LAIVASDCVEEFTPCVAELGKQTNVDAISAPREDTGDAVWNGPDTKLE